MAGESLQQAAYVYQILVEGIPRYIGKGRGDRARFHVGHAKRINRRRQRGEIVRESLFYNKLSAALRGGHSITIEIICSGLSDQEAYVREKVEIAAMPSGQLWNLLRGGEGGDPEFFKAHWAKPESRKHQSEKQKAVWLQDDYRAAQSSALKAACGTPEFREYRSREMKQRFQSPEYLAAHSEMTKRRWARDDGSLEAAIKRGRAAKPFNHSAATTQKWQDPEYREKLCKAQQARWTPEARAASAEKAKALWADPNYRDKTVEATRQGVRRKRIGAAS